MDSTEKLIGEILFAWLHVICTPFLFLGPLHPGTPGHPLNPLGTSLYGLWCSDWLIPGEAVVHGSGCRAERPLPVRQRQEVQEVLPPLRGSPAPPPVSVEGARPQIGTLSNLSEPRFPHDANCDPLSWRGGCDGTGDHDPNRPGDGDGPA